MSGENQKGFTIIETTLFLAISAMLFIGLLGGISLAVQRQRYSDSVNSTHSFLQKQFNETLNVINNRDEDCPESNEPTIGASKCLVLGKAIEFSKGSDEIKTYIVTGIQPPPPADSRQAVDLKDYGLKIMVNDGNEETFLIPWAAKISEYRFGEDRNKNVILLIRNPESGATYVYAIPSDSINSNGVINPSSINNSNIVGTESVQLCLQSEDISNAQAIVTFNGAGSQDGVTIQFDASGDNCGIGS